MNIDFAKIKAPALALTALFLIVMTLVMGMVYFTYSTSKQVLKSGIMVIPTGSNNQQRAAILFDEGFLKDTVDFNRFAKNLRYTKVYPGRYELKDGMSFKALFAVIGRGLQQPVNVTFNNIRNFEKLASVVSTYIEADSASIMTALTSDSLTAKYGFKQATLLSMFIPDTYQFYWNTSADEFLDRMNKEYLKFWSNKGREEKLKALEMSKEEVAILAPIVIEETKKQSEMAKVAGVYINRLKKGMPLQADPTVKFALGDPTIKRVLFKHLEVDSPYNTYKVQGLPPGVITMPPVSAIDAVLDYEKHDLYYFCASPLLDGSHRFAKNLSAHNVNAAAYAAALNKMGIRK